MSHRRTSLIVAMAILVLSACAPAVETSPRTGIAELDNIIEVALGGDVDELRSLIQFTQTYCTYAEGLGGPPKCLSGQAEGTPVEVLPFLGSEGSFIRKDNMHDWDGVQVASLYAVYEVSDSVFTDESYPRGEYAIVFIADGEQSSGITLQVRQGRIVRIDYGFTSPPEISESWVVRYLVGPIR